ncbi:MAG TPA: efflux RND transporter periplasmic adaptor subunit [Candidatus Limnocylindria bacterium]|jgi:HlyD family secretion protein|nr:efflux RND transporter periplasmic adaptor subunit [Candidatus Limnocylindria bacterium]
MSDSQLSELRIDRSLKTRRSGPFIWIFIVIFGIAGVVAFFAWPRQSDSIRIVGDAKSKAALPAEADPKNQGGTAGVGSRTGDAIPIKYASTETGRVEGSILTVPGYIVAHERIELSPRFLGVVKWIGVHKGDTVTNNQVLVLLDDSEYKARLAELDGQIGVANVGVEKARIEFKRSSGLVEKGVETQKVLDDARLALASAEAQVGQIKGARQLIETYIEWCTIRSPVNGVVLERLVDANELVTPQAFGGTRGPSTSLLAVADLSDLQVEIDVDESYISKVGVGQRCKLRPEAFPERLYDGYVAEIAPEASRQKGTLQIKVQIEKPDRFLTPELSAKVDFLPKK